MTPLWIGAVTNVVNVALVYVLVYGAFGIPSFGVPGAAVANGLAFSVGAVIFVVKWLRGSLIVGVGPSVARIDSSDRHRSRNSARARS